MAERDEQQQDERGRFVPGNTLWRLIEPYRAPRKYETPEALWAKCCEYFEWCRENPWIEDKVMSSDNKPTHVSVEKARAMTNEGLCVFLKIGRCTWLEWRRSREDLKDVIEAVDAIIYEHNFTGAAAGLLNQLIISRQLGLVDRSEVTGKDGEPLNPKLDDGEVARRLAFLLQKGANNGQSG